MTLSLCMTMTGSEKTEARLQLLLDDVELMYINDGLGEYC